MLTSEICKSYIRILQEELILATGCTEPVAIAYCAALARDVLGRIPERVAVVASGNIIKNVKSVVVPNTGGLHGIKAAAAAGIAAGNAQAALQVIASATDEEREKIKAYLQSTPISVSQADSPLIFDICIDVFAGEDSARVRIANNHTNVVLKELNGKPLFEKPFLEFADDSATDRRLLNVKEIVEFADTVDTALVKPMLQRQISCNLAIAEEGLCGSYGANVGKVLLKDFGYDVRTRARAYAAAGSDARMCGCEMPVVIISGSGNQGITASLPVIIYAKELNADEDRLYRALIVSDLVTIHQKTGIGRLSAYCGAVSAGCGAGAGIAYINGGDYDVVAHTIVNALAIISGTVCDGAKASCAAKIAAAVDAAIMGYHMYLNGQEFLSGDGIITKGVDNTIANIGLLAKEGMRDTDKEILKIMLKTE